MIRARRNFAARPVPFSHFKLGFIGQFAVDHVGAIIDRPCMKILRIRIDFGEFERMCRGGRSLSAPTISTVHGATNYNLKIVKHIHSNKKTDTFRCPFFDLKITS